jgi:hypothetical protein
MEPLHEENVKAQDKTIPKGTKDDEFPVDNTTLIYFFHIYDTCYSMKHLPTSQSPDIAARNNGDCPPSSHKSISAPELSKHLTTSQCPDFDATNNGDCPSSLHKLISAPELSKPLTTSQCPDIDATNNGDGLLTLYVLMSAPLQSKHST